jgi:hypothetical protein
VKHTPQQPDDNENSSNNQGYMDQPT